MKSVVLWLLPRSPPIPPFSLGRLGGATSLIVSGAEGWTGEGCMVDVIDSTSISSAEGRISLTIELTTNSCTLYHCIAV